MLPPTADIVRMTMVEMPGELRARPAERREHETEAGGRGRGEDGHDEEARQVRRTAAVGTSRRPR